MTDFGINALMRYNHVHQKTIKCKGRRKSRVIRPHTRAREKSVSVATKSTWKTRVALIQRWHSRSIPRTETEPAGNRRVRPRRLATFGLQAGPALRDPPGPATWSSSTAGTGPETLYYSVDRIGSRVRHWSKGGTSAAVNFIVSRSLTSSNI